MIYKLSTEHIDDICKIHIDSFQGDFLASLGRDFLKTMYAAMLDAKVGFGFVYLEHKDVLGFVIGSLDTKKLFKEVIKRNFFVLAVKVLRRIIARPQLLKSVIETFFYPKREGKIKIKPELMIIAVDKNNRGKGIGRQLTGVLDAEFKKYNLSQYKVTVLAREVGSNNFYRSLGFEYKYSFEMYGKKWNLYVNNIKSMAESYV